MDYLSTPLPPIYHLLYSPGWRYPIAAFYYFSVRNGTFILALLDCLFPGTPTLAYIVLMAFSAYLIHRYAETIQGGKIEVSELAGDLRVKIGGHKHQENWYDLARKLSIKLRPHILYNFREFKLLICINLGDSNSLLTFQKFLDVFLPPTWSRPKLPFLDLVIEILDKDTSFRLPQDFLLDLNRSGNLRKLTWVGPYAHIAFSYSYGAAYSKLAELRLFDCVIGTDLLVHILSCCTGLVVCEVHRVGRPRMQEVQIERSVSGLIQESSADIYRFFTQEITGGLGLKSTKRDNRVASHVCTPLAKTFLRSLTLSSTVDLEPVFRKVKLERLEILKVRLAPSACHRNVHYDLDRFKLDWKSIREFELLAPLDRASRAQLQRFLEDRKAYWSRKLLLIDDREVWYPLD